METPLRRVHRSFLTLLCLTVLTSGQLAVAGWNMDGQGAYDQFNDQYYLFWSPSRVTTADYHAHRLLEAQYSPHLFFFQEFDLHPDSITTASRVPDIDTLSNSFSEHVTSFGFIPFLRVRMLTAESTPVISPSYMPKFTFQYSRMSVLQSRGTMSSMLDVWSLAGRLASRPSAVAGTDTATGAALNPVPNRLAEWGIDCLPFAHHSNGQDEPTFLGGRLNEKHGSFSTNFFQFALHGRLMGGARLDPATKEVRYDVSLAGLIGFQYHLRVGDSPDLPGSIPLDLVPYMPRWKLIFEYDGEQFSIWSLLSPFQLDSLGKSYKFILNSFRYRAEMHLGGIHDKAIDQSFEWAISPWQWFGWGVFVRYYRGYDYYNILSLRHRLSEVHVGLVNGRSVLRVFY